MKRLELEICSFHKIFKQLGKVNVTTFKFIVRALSKFNHFGYMDTNKTKSYFNEIDKTRDKDNGQ